MECKIAQDYILTDYIDGRMDEKRKLDLESHIEGCHACKKFYMTAKKALEGLSTVRDRQMPPEFVWYRIREAILTEKQGKENFVTALLGKFKYIFSIPNPTFALATAFALLLVVATIARLHVVNQEAVQNASRENAEYLYYLGAPAEEVSSNGENGFGTSIEEYFL